MIWIFEGRCIPDLWDLTHVTGWELYSLHDLGHEPRADLYYSIHIMYNMS